MASQCLVCDLHTDDYLVVNRFDGTTYRVTMCVGCARHTELSTQPFLLAHDLIDARNGYRTRQRAA
jgi:hypothetical protein